MMRTATEAASRADRILSASVPVADIIAYLNQDVYLSKRSAAAYCDLGVKKIETAIRLGQVRAFSVGKKILIKRSELDAWIQAGEVTRAPEPQKTDLQDLVGRAIATAQKRRSKP